MNRGLESNIQQYPWLQFSSSLLGWLPIFFLYFSQYTALSEVIQLGAIYYLSVCLFEVPSGYFSDRMGRRITLLLAALAFIVSYVVFLSADSFNELVFGQVFLALAIAMISGTDTALLYDSLLSTNQQHNYATHEARGQKYGMAALALASLIGGILGVVDLRLPYLFSLLGAFWMLWIVIQLVEPEKHRQQESANNSFVATLKSCACRLKNGILAWLFGVMVLMYCLEHIAYEFYQPYIRLLDIDWLKHDSTSLLSGIVIAISMFGGSLGAAYSVKLYNKMGLKKLLYAAFAIQLIIIGGLSMILHGLFLGLVIFRNFPMAMIHAPVYAEIAPRIESSMRATYLSMQSLSARLVFSTLLFLLSFSVEGEALDWHSLSLVLRQALGFGAIGAVIAVLLAPAIHPQQTRK
jgi:MFS family permease